MKTVCIVLAATCVLAVAGWLWQRWYFARYFYRTQRILSLTWNPAGTLLAAYYNDGAIFLLSYDEDGRVSTRCLLPPGKYTPYSTKPKWSADGKMLAVCCSGDIVVWDVRPEAAEKHGALQGEPLLVLPVSWSTLSLPDVDSSLPRQDMFAWGQHGSRLVVFSVATRELSVWEPLTSAQPVGHPIKVAMSDWEKQFSWNISLAPDDKSVVFPCDDEIRMISLVDGSEQSLRKRVPDPNDLFWENLTWSGDGRSFVLYNIEDSNSEWGREKPIDLTISRIDSASGPDIVLRQKIVFTSPVPSPTLYWSSDGKRIGCSLISCYKSRQMKEYVSSDVMIWDVATGHPLFARNKSAVIFATNLYDLFLPTVWPADLAIHPRLEKYAEGEYYWRLFSVVSIVPISFASAPIPLS
ncbi:MAG TPA: hypothetical protein VK970_24205 [Candidatus Methylacidiphilales bacterium]|nr:hypothetical protein [Candidatus Methylacidiphilales bacterium]